MIELTLRGPGLSERFFDLHLKVYNHGAEYLTGDDLLLVAEIASMRVSRHMNITTNIKEMMADAFIETVRTGVVRDNSYLLPMLNTYNSTVASFETNPRYDANVQANPIDPFVVVYPSNKRDELTADVQHKLSCLVGYVSTEGKVSLAINYFDVYKLDTVAGIRAFITDVYIFNHDTLNSLRPNIMGEKSQ